MRRPDFKSLLGSKVLTSETMRFYGHQLEAWTNFMAEPKMEHLAAYNMYSVMLQAKMIQDFSRYVKKAGKKKKKRP